MTGRTLPSQRSILGRARNALASKGERRLADWLGGLRLEIDPVPQTWTIYGRPVLAYRGALLAPQRLLLLLRQHDADREAIRAAVRAAFDTREQVLRELSVVLDHTSLGVTHEQEVLEGHPYRDRVGQRPPSPAVLRTAAERFATATKDDFCAGLLARAKILCEPAAPPATDRARCCYRIHLLLSLDDLAQVHQDRSVHTRVAEVLRVVGTTLDHSIGEVTLRPWLEGELDTAQLVGPTRRRIAELQERLAAEGVASVLIGEVHGATRLVAHHAGETVVLDLVQGKGWREEAGLHLRIGLDEVDGAELARRVRKALATCSG